MLSLVDLLLSSSGLAPSTVSAEAFLGAVRAAAGPQGLVEELEHDGDAREPARLHALFASRGAPARRATLLFLHGKGGCGAEWRPDAVRALGLGYNVLVPELRGHPPSTGKRITYGLLERVDMELLLSECVRRFGIDAVRLGIDACSAGSSIALQMAAAGPRPRALWLQSPFGRLPQMAVHYASLATGLPEWLIALPVRLALRRVEASTGLPLASVDPVAAAARVTCPAVVVHGEDDELVPIRFAPAVYEALAGPKEFWRVPRCGHCHHADEPQAIRAAEYLRRWTEFFLAHLPPEGNGRRIP